VNIKPHAYGVTQDYLILVYQDADDMFVFPCSGAFLWSVFGRFRELVYHLWGMDSTKQRSTPKSAWHTLYLMRLMTGLFWMKQRMIKLALLCALRDIGLLAIWSANFISYQHWDLNRPSVQLGVIHCKQSYWSRMIFSSDDTAFGVLSNFCYDLRDIIVTTKGCSRQNDFECRSVSSSVVPIKTSGLQQTY